MKRTAVAAPAPRPSDDEMLASIAALSLGDFVRLKARLYLVFLRRGQKPWRALLP
jgi:hypothetical protein